ncbi:hypothetical protein HPB51_005745 [Rhipicephalus microplus]|uniref:DUF229 domain containing protein n=1 Tax=Rhipicephalus microplus TaxID=6941 RepID=A0A9J6EQZ5_RHIMP|nr:hypothetical protein HPB51_005745 [Rhipicephalus microplus]
MPIGSLFDTPGCAMPLYPLFHKTIRHANQTDISLRWRCPGRRATVVYRRGRALYLNVTRLSEYYGVESAAHAVCTYREVLRNETSGVPHDMGYKLGPSQTMNFGENLDEEFVAVECVAGIETLFTDYFFIPQLKNISDGKAGKPRKGLMNVLVLGIDSTSRMNFNRHMKRTRQFLLGELNAFELLGYNKVGDSSFGNQIPLLLGKPADEVKRIFRERNLDDLPLLWNLYSALGYATLFLEEMPCYGLFTYPNYRGFCKPPTDYYPVPILHAMEENGGIDIYCAGSRLKTQVLLEYLRDVLELNADHGIPLFSYVWLSDIPHSNDHALLVLDDPVHDLLRNMQKRRAFRDTVLVMLSDHGARFGSNRATVIGRHEDKTPFGYLVLPRSFLSRHPGAAVNLEVNQRRLVTAYDVHSTLVDLLRYTSSASEASLTANRGLSLLDQVPPHRSCSDAFVPIEFCECIGAGAYLDEQSSHVQSFAKFLVEYLNSLNEANFPTMCARWQLGSVTDAYVLDGRWSSVITMRVVIVTQPVAHFEAYGEVHDGNEEWRVLFVQRLDCEGWGEGETAGMPSAMDDSTRRDHASFVLEISRACSAADVG